MTNFAIDFTTSFPLLIIVLFLLSLISIKLIFSKNMLEIIVILSVFSLLISLSYLLMDAPDVAMTEVALGTCLSTCVFLNFIKKISKSIDNKPLLQTRILSSTILCFIFAVILIWASYDIALYGDANSPLVKGVNDYYVSTTKELIGIKSMVAAILASYRGFDTLGETSVILIAGFGIILIFSRRDKDA